MRKILNLVLLLLIIPPICFAQDAITQATPKHEEQTLQLNISSDRNLYNVGDEIVFLLNFTSNSQEDSYIYIDEFYEADLFNVTDELGNRQPSETTVFYDIMWSEESYKLVKAGESYNWKIRARILKDKNLVVDFGDSLIRLSHPGRFNIFVTYKGWDGITTDENGKEIAISKKLGLKNVFVDNLTSNTITIEVAEKK